MFYKTQCEAVKVCRQDFLIFNLSDFFLLLGDAVVKYDFRDPREKSRLEFYYDLIEKYQYPIEYIEFDVAISSAAPDYFSDIVIYKDNERKIPFIAVNCLRDKISKIDFEIGVKSAIIKASSLGAEFAVCISGSKKRVIKITRDKDILAQKIVHDLPIGYESEP